MNRRQFATLLQRGAVQYIRSDACLCGGLTNAKKIAALAEAYYAQVAPYNPLSPVSTAACVQLRFIATSATAPQAEQG